MAQRPKGCDSKVMSADGYVTGSASSNGPKNVYALVITATGATAGDKVALRATGPTGTVKVYFELPAAAGIWTVSLGRYGIEFPDLVYYTEQAATANRIKTTVIFG